MNEFNGKKTISILGCGWFGLPLAHYLLKLGYIVKGSTTTEAKLKVLQEAGISPYLVNLPIQTKPSINTSFFDCDILLINIPPKRVPEVQLHYVEQMHSLLSFLSKNHLKHCIFISSTSVYGENATNTEESLEPHPTKASGMALLAAEKLLKEHFQNNILILRFAGLIGQERHPSRFKMDRQGLKMGNVPVNLVHVEDCISVTSLLIQKNILRGVFNVCCDDHPSRNDFYQKAFKKVGLLPPEFLTHPASISHKIVSNKNLKEVLGLDFSWKYPSPMDMI